MPGFVFCFLLQWFRGFWGALEGWEAGGAGGLAGAWGAVWGLGGFWGGWGGFGGVGGVLGQHLSGLSFLFRVLFGALKAMLFV